MKVFVVVAILLLSPVEGWAQQYQSRNIFHPSVDVGGGWYGTVWLIGNLRQDLPTTLNLFPGGGYKTDKWWAEGLYWKQWSTKGESKALDVRFGITRPQLVLYSEAAKLFQNKGGYTFLFAERPIRRNLRIGGETEDFWRKKNSVGAGPRLSYVLGPIHKGQAVLTTAYQFRINEPDVVRVYLAIHPRF